MNAVSGFDKEYFEDKQLVCFIIVAPNPGYSYRLLKTNYYDDTLTIEIESESTNEMVIQVVAYKLAIIEIEKVPESTIINVDIIRRSWLW